MKRREPHYNAFSKTELDWYSEPVAIGCYDCGLPYGSDGWIEAIIPDDIWKQISPDGTGRGLLCINCIARLCAEQGFEDVDTQIVTGPLAVRDERA